MGHLIHFGLIDKSIIFAVISGIGRYFSEIVVSANIYNIYKNNIIHDHPFVIGLSAGLGLCLSAIPNYYLNKDIKSMDIEQIKNENRINVQTEEYKENYNESKIKKQKILFILFSSFLDFFQKCISFTFILNININYWLFDIIYISIFSRYILKTKIYAHKLITLIIMIILGIILIIINYYDEDFDKLTGFDYKIFLIFLQEFAYSLNTVVCKYSMEFKFCSPYEICLCEGFFQVITNILLLIIFSNIEFSSKNNDGKVYLDNFDYFKKAKFIDYIIFVISMFVRWTFALFSLIVIKKYTPSHVVLIIIIGEIGFAFTTGILILKIIKVIIFIFLIILILIFTEIIELNFFGLNKNTKKNISKRADNLSFESIDSNIELEVEGFIINTTSQEINENEDEYNANSESGKLY